MSKSIVVGRNVAPRRVVFLNRLRILRALVKIATARCYCVERLRHAPPATRHDHRVLHDVAGFEIDINPARVLLFAIARDTLEERDARTVRITNADSCQLLTSEGLVL